MKPKDHWEQVYSTKAATDLSWFQEQAQLSLKLIRAACTSASASIIDVGGGASSLADDLLGDGYRKLTILDLSGAALATTKSRLDDRADQICWMEANVLEAEFPANGFDLWHDRAVFHFLTYVRQVLHAVKPGGTVIIATFAEDGPIRCSGLPVMRYSAEALHTELGQPFRLLGREKELHLTPGGSEQRFIYCIFRIVDQE